MRNGSEGSWDSVLQGVIRAATMGAKEEGTRVKDVTAMGVCSLAKVRMDEKEVGGS